MAGFLGSLGVVFWGVITFSILVVLHEGGHFLAARAFGVKVHEFMLGLPGPALRIETKNMTWGVTAIPLGGYVRIAGMEPGAEDELLGPALKAVAASEKMEAGELAVLLGVPRKRATAILTTLEDWAAIVPLDEMHYAAAENVDRTADEVPMLDRARSITYRGLKTWKRIVVLCAGVTVNIVTAILTFTIVLSVWGIPGPDLALGSVVPASAAATAGLTVGDRITAVNGTTVESWEAFLAIMGKTSPKQAVTIAYERGGTKSVATVTLGEQDGRGFLGVGAGTKYTKYPVLEALGQSFQWTGMVFVAVVNFFNPSTFGESIKGARGVVGIAVMASDAAKSGPLDYAWLIALLSLSLGAMNILPIPPLDGGKIAVEIVERIAGRPLGRRLSIAMSAAGAILLFSLIGYLLYADVVRIVS
ncbi:MAG: RIP metalloprotease RseP [Actinomycetota bacterium]|nr:MAG: regulator of sigma E [Actinomycetota bacterium]MDP3630239.1 RIP metalloprotease RseP [Actinomycetota bacterium]